MLDEAEEQQLERWVTCQLTAMEQSNPQVLARTIVSLVKGDRESQGDREAHCVVELKSYLQEEFGKDLILYLPLLCQLIMYKSIAALLLLLVCVHGYRMSLKMGLDPVLSKTFPRDFKTIPFGTDYGVGSDESLNKEGEARRLQYLEGELMMDLKKAVGSKTTPMFTTALIAGDAVILDALAKADLLHKVPVVFVDTFTLFPESLGHLREVEKHYGFQSKIYNA
ncbi:hypothetical protein B484DRAFT_406388, partial [Ochromonadaceae sp. CCMP2298]